MTGWVIPDVDFGNILGEGGAAGQLGGEEAKAGQFMGQEEGQSQTC